MPIAGDWRGRGVDGVGVYVPEQGRWYLRVDLEEGAPDVTFTFGPQRAVALAGRWRPVESAVTFESGR